MPSQHFFSLRNRNYFTAAENMVVVFSLSLCIFSFFLFSSSSLVQNYLWWQEGTYVGGSLWLEFFLLHSSLGEHFHYKIMEKTGILKPVQEKSDS